MNPYSGRPMEVVHGVSKTDSVTGSPCPAGPAERRPGSPAAALAPSARGLAYAPSAVRRDGCPISMTVTEPTNGGFCRLFSGSRILNEDIWILRLQSTIGGQLLDLGMDRS